MLYCKRCGDRVILVALARHGTYAHALNLMDAPFAEIARHYEERADSDEAARWQETAERIEAEAGKLREQRNHATREVERLRAKYVDHGPCDCTDCMEERYPLRFGKESP